MSTRSVVTPDLPMMTRDQAKLLAWFLCDPFLTVDECLRLVGVVKSSPNTEEDSGIEQLTAA